MSARVATLTQATPDGGLLASHLDLPAAGDLPGYVLEVGGWAVGRHAAVEAVQVRCGEEVLGRTAPRVDRPDVVARVPQAPPASGFWLAVGLLGLPPDFTLVVEALHAGGGRSRLGTLTGSYRLPVLADAGVLAPLTVSGLGRSGTTWLMRMLAAHPRIVVHDRHPYESRVLGWWLHHARVVTRPVPFELSRAAQEFAADAWQVAPFPYRCTGPRHDPRPAGQGPADDWLVGEHVHDLLRFATRAVDGFYRAYAAGRPGPQPLYAAEKSEPSGHAPWIAGQVYAGAREVFLVRDFRDVFTSVLAFNARRGYDSFGRERVRSDEEYLHVFARRAAALVEAWQARRQRSVLVRYEHLVDDPGPALARMLAALGLAGDREVAAMVAAGSVTDEATRRHRTADGDGVGRWKTDLPADLATRADAVLGPLMDAFA